MKSRLHYKSVAICPDKRKKSRPRPGFMTMVGGKVKPSGAAVPLVDPGLKADLLGGAAPIASVGIDQPSGVNADLLRGAKAIALEIYVDDGPATVRRLYHEQNRWPIFRLEDDGVFYALRSRLRAHLVAKSAEKEAQLAAAAQAELKAAAKPKPRRRRARAASNKVT